MASTSTQEMSKGLRPSETCRSHGSVERLGAEVLGPPSSLRPFSSSEVGLHPVLRLCSSSCLAIYLDPTPSPSLRHGRRSWSNPCEHSMHLEIAITPRHAPQQDLSLQGCFGSLHPTALTSPKNMNRTPPPTALTAPGFSHSSCQFFLPSVRLQKPQSWASDVDRHSTHPNMALIHKGFDTCSQAPI